MSKNLHHFKQVALLLFAYKTNLQKLPSWFKRRISTYRASFKQHPKQHLAVLASLALIISLIPILTSIKRSQTSQATGLQLQSVSPRIGAPAGGDKVILKGRDFQNPSSSSGSFNPIQSSHLSAGNAHSCVIGSDSKTYCWGKNDSSQSGDGNYAPSQYLPVPTATSQGAIPNGVILTHLSAGGDHTCALGSNSKVYCWGLGNFGQLGNGSSATYRVPAAISQGAIPAGVNLTHVSAGSTHTCTLDSNGKAYCWGENNNGALGNNSTWNSNVPVAVSQGTIPFGVNLTHLSAGGDHTCALGSNSKIYCWGKNDSGQLGNGAGGNYNDKSLTPVTVSQGAIPNGVNPVQISAGYKYTCALGSDHKAYCWGKNGSGQFGNGTGGSWNDKSLTPVAVSQGAIPNDVTLTYISAGGEHTCALGSDHKAYCWGKNDRGQLGNNSTTNSLVPVAIVQGAIPTGVKLTQITTGGAHTCALGSNNRVYCWGLNMFYGSLGNNSNIDSSVPVTVVQGAMPNIYSGTTVKVDGVTVPVRYISSTELEITMPAHAEGLVNISVTNPDNSTHTLNQSYEYYQAKNPTLSSISPNTVSPYGGEIVTLTGNNFDTARWRQVSVGNDHTCALDYRNKAYCWGWGSSGQLGNNSTTNSSTPVVVSQGAIPSNVNLTHLSVGNYHTCALGSDHKAYCWGYNNSGQLGNNSTTNSSTPVAVSQGAIPSGVTLTQIAVGLYHTCALGSDNKAYCWGNGYYSQLGNNSITDSRIPVAVAPGAIPSGVTLTQISAGAYHTCALGSNDKAYCWGKGGDGQLGNNSTSNSSTPVAVVQGAIPSGVNLTQISAGEHHTCALGSDHKAYCWGKNEYGQLGTGSAMKAKVPAQVTTGYTLKLSDNNSSMHYAYDQANGFSNTQLKIRTPAGPTGLKSVTLHSHYLQLDSIILNL